MLRLNDDCLFEILKKMELTEQLNMARACIRFQNIIEKVLRPQFSDIEVSSTQPNKLNSGDIQTLLQVAAPNLKRLNILDLYDKDECLRDIVFYSTLDLNNLVELNLSGTWINDDYVQLFANNCKELRIFTVNSPEISGDHIAEMGQLRDLRFYYCSVEPKKLERILTQVPLVNLELTRNYFHVSEALMNIPVSTLRQLVVSYVMNFGVVLLEKLPLTSLFYELPISDFSENSEYDDEVFEFENIEPPNELKRIKSNLYKLIIFDNMNCIHSLAKYLHSETPEIEFKNFVSMSFPNLILHLIDSCNQLECFETLLNKDRFFTTAINQFTEEIIRRNRSFRLVFYYIKAESVDDFRKYLQQSSVYNQQKEFTIELKQLSEYDYDWLSYVRYYMRETNE